MLDRDTQAGYGKTTIILSSLIVICFLSTFVVSVSWPLMNVGDPERDFRKALHMSMGVIVFILIVLRLIWWSMNESPKPPPGVPANAIGLSRTTTLFLYIDMLGLAVTGFMSSWAKGYEVSFLGLFDLPIIPGTTVAFSGYGHSIFLFFNNLMMLSFIVVNLYIAIRYKAGFRRIFPGPQV